MQDYLRAVLKNMPSDWLNLTTHRLDIYDEQQAKTQFLDQFEALFQENNASTSSLAELATAYDYIRLGHPLSSILEWALAKLHHLQPEAVISFSSRVSPILAVLRKNLFLQKPTQILYVGQIPSYFDAELIKKVYGYSFEVKAITSNSPVPGFEGTTVYVHQKESIDTIPMMRGVDFTVSIHEPWGSILFANGHGSAAYLSEIQHVRRRETIAMTPIHCLAALKQLLGEPLHADDQEDTALHKAHLQETIKEITGTHAQPLVASSGLSIQYAIMMGLIEDALEKHPGKAVKFIVPPNCYGGTNDQARRVAACLHQVEIVDLHVDGDHDMVQSLSTILDKVAWEDAIPYIIAEIPTNPRVEVPDLKQLKAVLSETRKTASSEIAMAPVFILDQTFCPNVHFLEDDHALSSVRAISYASGSKFPSGGLCTAGYCVANQHAAYLIPFIEKHLFLCDNEATALQYEILAKQMPSMNQRIEAAYKNTRAFVNFIRASLPSAKINFVSEELAKEGFMPSVFSLDLPTKGATEEEKEAHKRALNLKLITRMIHNIPDESKFCVSYGQLKGCYWTVPATSTQGTTKEGDKDYIVRISVSPQLDLDRHQKEFLAFVNELE